MTVWFTQATFEYADTSDHSILKSISMMIGCVGQSSGQVEGDTFDYSKQSIARDKALDLVDSEDCLVYATRVG